MLLRGEMQCAVAQRGAERWSLRCGALRNIVERCDEWHYGTWHGVAPYRIEVRDDARWNVAVRHLSSLGVVAHLPCARQVPCVRQVVYGKQSHAETAR